MKSSFSLPTLAAVSHLLFGGFTATAGPVQQQHPLSTTKMTETADESTAALRAVPGHNNAFYGPVPKQDQLFVVDYLEIAPTPIPVDKFFFVLLRGELPASADITADQLAAATLSITLSNSEEKEREPTTYTVPFRTEEFADEAHIAIRDAKGKYVDHLTPPGSGRNDVLADYWIPGMFLRTGEWTFEIVTRLEDGRCLFAISVVQFLEGGLH